MDQYLTWAGITFCLSQSAIFSGLNLAFFNMSRLRLEIQVANGNKAAARILKLREDSNFLLTTILWGNVSINVLLALLSPLCLLVATYLVLTLNLENKPRRAAAYTAAVVVFHVVVNTGLTLLLSAANL